MTYYRTTITIDVLSSEPIGEVDFADLSYEVTLGSWSGKLNLGESKEISRQELERACEEHHTDPSYFTEWDEEE